MYNDLSPQLTNYLVNKRGIDLSKLCKPRIRTPEPVDYPGAKFEGDYVDHVIDALSLLRHTQGKWAGQPLVPDAWQIAFILAPIFGWHAPNEDGKMVRIISKANIDVSRKNGKTTLASGLALYLAFADGEAGAQVLAVAGSRDQAGNAYRPAKLIAEHSPEFKAGGIRALQTQIVKYDGSFFKAVASAGDLIHGANVSGAVVDELHVHKDGTVLEAVESGTVSREQPLVFIISTADDGRPESVYAQQRNLLESVANGSVKMPELYGCVWGATDEDDPFIEETWRKANPGYGISVTAAYMRKAAAEAKESPIALASFKRLHLGMRTKQVTKFIDMGFWRRNAGVIEPEKLLGKAAYGGLDLASTSDLTALTWVFPDENGGYDSLYRVFLPENAVAPLDRRTHGMASAWVKEGLITVTSGDVVDYDFVKAQIRTDMTDYDVQELAYDPWNARQLANDLMAEDVPLVEFRQGLASMSAPLKELVRLLGEGTEERPLLRHGNNPLITWQVDNFAVKADENGNVKPDKKNANDKIDSVVALTMAVSRAMARTTARRSAYEEDDLLFA